MFAEERMYRVITISRSLAKRLERLIEELRGKNENVMDYGDAIEFLVEFYERFKNTCTVEWGAGSGAQGGEKRT